MELSCSFSCFRCGSKNPQLSVTTVLHSWNWLFGSREEQISKRAFLGLLLFWFYLLFPKYVFCQWLSQGWEGRGRKDLILGGIFKVHVCCCYWILKLRSSATLYISGVWYFWALPVSCLAGRLIQFMGETVMPLVNASGKGQQVICNPEKVVTAFFSAAHLAGGQRARNHHPELLLSFLAHTRSLAPANLQGWV